MTRQLRGEQFQFQFQCRYRYRFHLIFSLKQDYNTHQLLTEGQQTLPFAVLRSAMPQSSATRGTSGTLRDASTTVEPSNFSNQGLMLMPIRSFLDAEIRTHFRG